MVQEAVEQKRLDESVLINIGGKSLSLQKRLDLPSYAKEKTGIGRHLRGITRAAASQDEFDGGEYARWER